MSKIITKEQLNKLNEKMSNDWTFDQSYYYLHSGEKTAIKRIRIDEKSYLEAQLYFSDEYDWNARTDNKRMKLNISKFYGNTSYGLGIFYTVAENVSKKSFSLIQKETANWTDEKIIALAKRHENILDDSTLIDKNGAHLHEV